MFAWVNSVRGSILKNKILVENFAFLSVLQVSNLILFIITIPYLFRVLGSHNYGLIVFAQTVAFYFSILINFGFNLTATRDISVHRDNPDRISEIVSTVLIVKMILFILSFFFMVVLTSSIPVFRENRVLFLLSMLACLSDALFPVWYFQGIEKMKYITWINIITRIGATIFVFVFIIDESCYIYYPLIIGAGTISGGIIALIIITFKQGVYIRIFSVRVLIRYLKDNFLYFISNISTQLYGNANRLVAGIFLGMVDVAYYDLAEKIVNICKVPYFLISQALFPRIARNREIRLLLNVLGIVLLISIVIIIVIFFFSPFIIRVLSGYSGDVPVMLLRLLLLSLLPVSISILFGDIILLINDLKTEYSLVRITGLMIYLILFTIILILGKTGLFQLALIVLIVEAFIAGLSYYFVRKTGALTVHA